MSYNEDIQDLLDKIEVIVSKEYNESLDKITKESQAEIARLNAVIDAYREVATKAHKDADAFERENKRLVAWIDNSSTLNKQ